MVLVLILYPLYWIFQTGWYLVPIYLALMVPVLWYLWTPNVRSAVIRRPVLKTKLGRVTANDSGFRLQLDLTGSLLEV